MIGMVKGTTRQMKQVAGLPAPIASFRTNMSGNINSLKVLVEAVQSGSGTPSPSNPRPISGWSGAVVSRTGKNLCPLGSFAQYAYSFATNQTFSGMVNPFFLKGGKTYTLSIESGKTLYRLRAFKKTQELVDDASVINMTSEERGLTYYSNYKFFGFSVTPSNVYQIQPTEDIYLDCVINNSTASDVMLVVGSSSSPYEPYNGISVTIPFGQTVYGGVLDVTSGVLTLNNQIVVCDGSEDESWNTAQNAFYLDNAIDVDSEFRTSETVNQCLCNSYKESNSVSSSSQVPQRPDYSFFNQAGTYYNRIWVKNSNCADVTAFKTTLSNQPMQLVYPLATPQTITLSPQQISQLLGINNVFADCGDVEELKHINRIDTVLFSKG